MSIAQIKQTSAREKSGHTQEMPAQSVNPSAAVDSPKMLQEYKVAQSSSKFWELPADVEPLILNASGKSVIRLGMTCKYWNLRVRGYLQNDPSGRKLVRSNEEVAFRNRHRISVVDAFREMESSSHQKFFEFDDSFMGDECIHALKTSDDPVHLCLPSDPGLLSKDFKSALATRRTRLTILDIDAPHGKGIPSMVAAINAIPRGAFAALVITSDDIRSENAAMLWATIVHHPVVVHIEVDGDGTLATGEQIVDWITQLAEKDAQVSSFALNRCRMDEQSANTLSRLTAASAGIRELEISEDTTSMENVTQLAEVIRSRNAGAAPKLTVYFDANNLDQLIDARSRSTLAAEGLVIRNPDEIWAVQRDPALDDSSSDDSSSVVGEHSEGDEDYGSGFDIPGNDSDAVVESSSDSEG